MLCSGISHKDPTVWVGRGGSAQPLSWEAIHFKLPLKPLAAFCCLVCIAFTSDIIYTNMLLLGVLKWLCRSSLFRLCLQDATGRTESGEMLLSAEDGPEKHRPTDWRGHALPALLSSHPLNSAPPPAPLPPWNPSRCANPGRSAWPHPSCGSCPPRSSASSWSALASSGAWCCCTSPSSSEPATRTAPCWGSRSWTWASATSRRWPRRTRVWWTGPTWAPWRHMVSDQLPSRTARDPRFY